MSFNKYWVATIIFVVVTFLIGEYTLVDRYKHDKEISRLKQDIEQYKQLNEQGKQEIEALRTDDEALEKYAREELLMVKPGEEVFIIKDN